MTSLRELFGGAITMDLPSNLIDASDLRQVPDTQEVFISPGSDVSFVVEVLKRVDLSDAEGATKFHFEALAHDNSATSQEIDEIIMPSKPQSASPPATPNPIILAGRQAARKWNSQIADEVRILMALYRVEAKDIDLVFSANIPQTSREDQRPDEELWTNARHSFVTAAESLKIVDFGLFA